ncbi:SAMD12 (predicted) [Pycnogonum litorale]
MTKTKSTSSGNDSLKTNIMTRPRPVFFWSNSDVMKWLYRHCHEPHTQYVKLFLHHDITGRSLMRMNEATLEKIGITNPEHREEICREILKLKLKSDILEMKDLEHKSGGQFSAHEHS